LRTSTERFIFTVDDCVHGIELWKSNGTSQGTVMVKDIIPGSGSSSPANLVASGSEVFFDADNGTNGRELWKSDGFGYGTKLVHDIEAGSGGGSVNMVASSPLGIFFSPRSTSIGYELHLLPTLPMYRLYSDLTKEHLYTTDSYEDMILGTRQWQREGVAYRIFPNASTPFEGVTPTGLHRLYHPGIKQHLWTVDAFEAQTLPSSGWVYEGVVGYILPAPSTSSIPLYRMAYASPLLHLWTIDQNEYTTLSSMGWAPEGAVGHVIP
jgi:ELWxxDGT repeat protein